MALPFFNWSRTAASNATADSTINWAEGQLPSTVNDSARAMMASIAGYRDDTSGALATGGTATAYTVTTYQVFSSLSAMSGQIIAFVPHATNTNAVGVDCTLNVDGLGAKPIRMQVSTAIPNGTLILGTPYVVMYENVAGVFYLRSMTNPYSIPLAGGMDFWGTTAPNSSFAFPIGQALSRSTYATLFSIMSTTYGVGDGSSTFNLPDKTGRVSAMKEASATRLTNAGSGITGSTMGSASGVETNTLIGANLPAYTPAGTLTSMSGSLSSFTALSTAGLGAAGTSMVVSNNTGGLASLSSVSGTVSVSGNFSGQAQGGTSTAFSNAQPTIICNYIIRII